MPIFFYSDPNQVIVEFTGGDLIAGLCGEEESKLDCVGIAEAVVPGVSGEEIGEDDLSQPSVFLKFQTPASLDAFMNVLQDYREARFGDSPRD